MKHLKKYKLFESQEDLISDVRDILADVSDKERAELVVDMSQIIIGIGNDDNLFSTIEESKHLRWICWLLRIAIINLSSGDHIIYDIYSGN